MEKRAEQKKLKNNIKQGNRFNRSSNTAITTTTQPIRFKNTTKGGSSGGGGGGDYRSSPRNAPPTAPPATAHSNSTGTTSKNINHHQQYQHVTNRSPEGSMTSGVSCCNSNSSASKPANVGDDKIKQQKLSWRQRQSPREQNGGDFFSKNWNYKNNKRYNAGSAQNQEQNGGTFFRNKQSYCNNNRNNGGTTQEQQYNCQKWPKAESYGGPWKPSPERSQNVGAVSGGWGKAHAPGNSSPCPTPPPRLAMSKFFVSPPATALPMPPLHWRTSKTVEKKEPASSAGVTLLLAATPTQTTSPPIEPGAATANQTSVQHAMKCTERNLHDSSDTHSLKSLSKVQCNWRQPTNTFD